MSEPTADRPIFPEGYGTPENNDNLLPWSYVEERMTPARNYWIVTASHNGRPAATPVWGVWLDGKLYFDGSPQTRRGRNIAQNPHVVVHLESGDQVLILEGQASILTAAPDRTLATRLAAAYTQKYAAAGYSPTSEQWDAGGLFIFQPETVLAWTQFPQDTTRWKLSSPHQG